MSVEGSATEPSAVGALEVTAAEARAPSDSEREEEEEGSEKRYTISQELFEMLLLEGFSENAIKKSIVAGCIDAKTCTQWIRMHEGHPELDTPLEDGVTVTVKVKRVLTESEREEKVKELKEKIKRKKEEDALEAARKEIERIEMGRKALQVKEEMEAVRRKMELDEVKRQKAADAAARKRIKVQILADRFVRQGKDPEEALRLAERSIEEEAEKARAAAAAASAANALQGLPAGPPLGEGGGGAGGTWNLTAFAGKTSEEDRLQRVFSLSRNDAAESASLEELVAAVKALPESAKCLGVLQTVLRSILSSPLDAKKRTLRTSTKTFSQSIRPVEPALRLLRLCNFTLETDSEGSEVVACKTVVIWQLEHALALLQGA